MEIRSFAIRSKRNWIAGILEVHSSRIRLRLTEPGMSQVHRRMVEE